MGKRLGVRPAGFALVSPFTSCMILGKSLDLSELQFPHLNN
jgi:hypothetical protein